MARNFTVGHPHLIDLRGRVKMGEITQSTLEKLFYDDGRIMGLVVEHLLQSEFDNVVMNHNKTGPWDVRLTTPPQRYFEVRGMKRSDSSTDFIKSSMKGKGRKFDPVEQADKLTSIDGFIIVDSGKAPLLYAVGVLTGQFIGNKNPASMTEAEWRISRKQLYNLVGHPVP